MIKIYSIEKIEAFCSIFRLCSLMEKGWFEFSIFIGFLVVRCSIFVVPQLTFPEILMRKHVVVLLFTIYVDFLCCQLVTKKGCLSKTLIVYPRLHNIRYNNRTYMEKKLINITGIIE